MQIHELNNFTGTLGSGAYLAVDDGNDTGKLSTQQLLAATEARIDNIIAGPAPSAEEIVDARLGDDGVTYPSLGDAIRDQVGDLKSELNHIENLDVLDFTKYASICVVGGLNSNGTVDSTKTWRIVTTENVTFAKQTTVTIEDGYQLGVLLYSGGSYSGSGWEEGSYTFSANGTYKFSIQKKNSYTAADVDTFLQKVVFPPYELLTKLSSIDADVDNIKDGLETDKIADITYALKGWQDGTGFIDSDEVMSPSEVLQSDDYGTSIYSDFAKYEILLYYFTSSTNKYPHYEGAFRENITVPAGQYFTYLIRYRTGNATLAQEDIENIPIVTKCIKNIGIWEEIEDIKKSIGVLTDNICPYNEIFSDYALATQIQDGVRIGNKLYQFTGSGQTIGDYNGHILEIDLDTKQLKDEMYHDLGHASCLSYNESLDTLVVARVSNSVPMIQLYQDFTDTLEPNAILEPSNSNCIVIELDDDILRGRTGFEAIYGENTKTLYCFGNVVSEYNNTILLYKVLLGTGSEDLSSETDGYGTLISGAQVNEYNGTCKIIGSWYLPSMNRQPQLIRWYKGKLYVLTGNKDTIIYRYFYINDKFYEDAKYYIYDIEADGSIVQMEPESLILNGDKTYLGLWDKTSPTKMRLLSVDL